MDIATPFPGRPPMPFLGPKGSGLSGLGDAASDAQIATAAIQAAQQAYTATILAGQPGYQAGYINYNPYAGTVSGGISGGTVLLIGLAIAAVFMARR